jgi:drug/metabolite transporter (DMT)-like permease
MEVRNLSVKYWIVFLIYLVFGMGGLLTFKVGAHRDLHFSLSNSTLSINANTFVFVGAFCYIISFFLYLFLLSKLELSYLIPLGTAVSYLITFAAGILLFKETISFHGILGAGLIIVGALIINIKN